MHVDLGDTTAYPSKQDILGIHSDIVSEDEDATEGIINDGNVDFTLTYIQHGYYGECPETIHKKAVHLMRLLTANHSFADGNKRTALNTTWAFYFINGYHFGYGEEMKAILKLYAVMEEMVDTENVQDYFAEITIPIEDSPDVNEDIRRLFSYYREAAQLLDEIEETLDNIDQIENAEGMISKSISALEVFQSIEELISKNGSEDMSIFEEGLKEESDRLASLIRKIADLAEESEQSP